jgi:mono/diheme cytochrome c family protein
MARSARSFVSVLAAAGLPIAAVNLLASAAVAEKPSFNPAAAIAGEAVFKTYCATCHGRGGEGDGPLADSLRVRPPDLTQFARREKGRFDAERAHRIIDGRNPVKGHGGSDMPIWGDAFKSSREGYSEEKVAERIDALVNYLASIQRED